jgi:hypothetical protein
MISSKMRTTTRWWWRPPDHYSSPNSALGQPPLLLLPLPLLAQIKINLAYYAVYEVVGLLSHLIDIAKSKPHSFRKVDIAILYRTHIAAIDTRSYTIANSSDPKNSLKPYDDFTMQLVTAMSTSNTAMSTQTSECIKTIANCIKSKQKISKFSRKSLKSLKKTPPKSKKSNRQICIQNLIWTLRNGIINDFLNHQEKLSKFKIRELPLGSVYF